MINLRRTLNEAHSILETQGIAHALIGSFALAVYEQHRATVDIDFLTDGTKKELLKTVFFSKGYILKYESNEVLQFTGPGFVGVLLANRPLSHGSFSRVAHHRKIARTLK